MKHLTLFITVFALFVVSCTDGNKASKQSFITIDVNKDYPKKEITLQNIAKVDYIPLEVSDDVLIDKYRGLRYVSKDTIITYNSMKGDVFIFNGEGKIIGSFNHRGAGGQEYLKLIKLMYSNISNEIFIQDSYKNQRLQVYNTQGKFLRTIKLSDSIRLGRIVDFDEKHLLCYENKYVGYSTDKDNKPSLQPFIFISKETGEIDSRLPIKLTQRISNKIMDMEKFHIVLFAYQNIVSANNHFIICEEACDTIFTLTKDKQLKPLLARTPSVNSSEDVILTHITNCSDQYIFMDINERTYNFETNKRGKRQYLALNRKTNQIFEYNLKNSDNEDSKIKYPHSKLIDADVLVDALEEGKLSGKLKAIAEKLSPEDNPVLMVVNLR